MDISEYSGSISAEFSWDTIRLALESDGEGIYDWDITTGKIKYSSHCLDLLGIPKNATTAPNIFTDWDCIIIEGDRSHFESSLRRYLEGHSEIPFRIETRLFNPGRTAWRWARITGIALRDASNNPLRLIGAFVDITRRKTAEAKLEEEKHLFRTLIDHIPDNIFFKNRESRFVVANASTAKKLGVPTPSDLIGRTDASFFDKELAKKWREEERHIMDAQEPVLSTLRQESRPGKNDSWCISTKLPWLDKLGHVKGILGITSDVTPLIETQNQLKATARELEKKNIALEKEMRLAREVQLALLPQQVLPITYTNQTTSTEGTLRFAHKYQASGGVAGDWFEVFRIDEQKTGIFICDVMGHGVRSALVASMIRGLLEEALREDPTPSGFLSIVNAKLTRILARSDATMFATAFYMLINLEDKTIRYSSAGHPAPYLSQENQPYTNLNLPKGIALGFLETSRYKEEVIDLKPSTKLLLYTDGLIEASNRDGEEIGKSGILSILNDIQSSSASKLVESTLKLTSEFTGDKSFDDDICLLSLFYEESELKA